MLELQNPLLQFSFPEVHPKATCIVQFQRTLRIPDDNRSYPLPPGLGAFPLFHVDDYASKLPQGWKEHGGVFLPMYQAEAMWICFSAENDYPFAIKVAAGKINAVTGNTWTNPLSEKPQDYVVIPDQPWLDGFCVQEGLIRQFVAMPLGAGFTAEEQLTGEAQHGGLQIIVYPMKPSYFEKLQSFEEDMSGVMFCRAPTSPDMGLAPGGLMHQHIYRDKFGLDAWDTEHSARCFVHILNSQQFKAITGQNPPTTPPTPTEYTNAGLPWFNYYAPELEALPGAESLAGLDSVAAKTIKQGQAPLKDNEAVSGMNVVKIQPKDSDSIRDGKW